MNRKKKIICIILLFVVLVSIIGFTFAYIGTRILGNSNSKKMSFTSKKVSVTYKEISNTSSGETISPGYQYLKIFTATNTGNVEVKYHIYLDEVENNFIRVQDITYTLYRKSGNNSLTSSNYSTGEVVSSGTFPINNTYIKINELLNNPGDVYTYALKINYNTSSESQDSDSGHVFGFKVQLHTNMVDNIKNAITSFDEGTLAYNIYTSAMYGKNQTVLGSEVTEFTKSSGENERLLNNAPDDYGTSYYYYGAVTDNYVSFANKLWRIVRINGDGSIRVVLDDVAKNDSNGVIAAKYRSISSDNAYVGYMYGTGSSTTYDATHKNINDSTIKSKVDEWYKTNIVDTNNTDYVAETLFCNDKTLASDTIGTNNTAKGYGTNKTYYASIERLQYSTGSTNITISKPTFKCAENATNDYSRFTVSVQTLPNGNKTNANLTYPVGLLTADDVVYAGAYKYNTTIRRTYLYNSLITTNWWLLTPDSFNGTAAHVWYVSANGLLTTNSVINFYAFRPVVNLKSSVLVNAGDGTQTNPYVIE